MVPVYANNRSIASAETQIFAAQDVLILINGESLIKSWKSTGSKSQKDVAFDNSQKADIFIHQRSKVKISDRPFY